MPWGGLTTSLLPEEHKPGERLHQLVERLSVRLGEQNVVVPQPVQDHRPECMQRWMPADGAGWGDAGSPAPSRIAGVPASPQPTNRRAKTNVGSDPLLPPWLLREPLRLQVKGDQPCYQGPLQLLTRPRRLEAAWWDPGVAQPVLRDYFIARSASAGLLWIFRERLAADQDRARWFLHGLYA